MLNSDQVLNLFGELLPDKISKTDQKISKTGRINRKFERLLINIVSKDAVLSGDGVFRFKLTRFWNEKPALVFIMLNPSKADAEEDDPTVKRCMCFAWDLGFGGIIVHNLFAYRATKVKDLKKFKNPIGPGNDQVLEDIDEGYTVCVAWGANGAIAGRDKEVIEMFRKRGMKLFCLGTTKKGFPRHPLYLHKATKLIEYDN